MVSMNISQLLSKYGVSPTLGFLSPDRPPVAFTKPYYAEWDRLAAQLPDLQKCQKLAGGIQELSILDASHLESEPEWRRAYVVLGFLIHAYVWGSSASRPTHEVPAQLSEPFLQVCGQLGVEPVLSYSGLVLWNWSISKDCTFDDMFPDLHHLESLTSFTGTRGEDAFCHVPVLVEAEGGPLVPLLLQAIEDGQQGKFAAVQSALETTTATLVRMGAHLPKVFAILDAHMFYHELRPFFAGGKGLPRGIVFQKSDGTEIEAKCVGGSAAQSSLFPFLDHVLGVVHEEAKSRESVFQEMRSYMPGNHREFLDIVGRLPSLRSIIERQSADAGLCAAYDECLTQLRLWRGKHIAVVSKYIVQPARAAAKAEQTGEPAEQKAGDELQGTGGSALMPFLRQARDETRGLDTGDDNWRCEVISH